MNEVNFAGKFCEESGFFACRVATSDDTDGDVAVKCSIACGACCQAVSTLGEFFFTRESEIACRGTGADDDGFGLVDLFSDFECEGAVVFTVDGFDVAEFNTGSKTFGLLLHVDHELGACDALREAGEVFYFGSGCELASWLGAGQDERVEIGTCCVDGGGITGRASSNDDDVFHVVESIDARNYAAKSSLGKWFCVIVSFGQSFGVIRSLQNVSIWSKELYVSFPKSWRVLLSFLLPFVGVC